MIHALIDLFYKVLLSDADVEEKSDKAKIRFFRRIMSSVTEMPSGEDFVANWSDAQIKNWLKSDRTISKAEAKKVSAAFEPSALQIELGNLSKTNAWLFIQEVGNLGLSASKNLNDCVNASMAALLNEIIKAAGLKGSISLKDQYSQHSQSLKGAYGAALLKEAGFTCSCPNCSTSLSVSQAGRTRDVYEIFDLNFGAKKQGKFKGLLAVCPNCFAKLTISASKQMRSDLEDIKLQMGLEESLHRTLENYNFHQDLRHVIQTLASAKLSRDVNFIYTGTKIENKLDDSIGLSYRGAIQLIMPALYPAIDAVFKELEAENDIVFEIVESDFHSMYVALKSEKKSQADVVSAIIKKVVSATKCDRDLATILTAYFIQKCDIFRVKDEVPHVASQ